MPRTLTATQLSNVQQSETWPILLVQLNHSGTAEYLSGSGAVTYDSQAYTAGGCNVRSIVNSESATIVINPTSSRLQEIQNSNWRGGICKIYYIPALASDVSSPTFTATEGLLLLDGIIDTSSFQGEALTLVARHKYLSGRMGPGYTASEIAASGLASYIPAVGSSIEWEGETISYEQWITTTLVLGGLRGG